MDTFGQRSHTKGNPVSHLSIHGQAKPCRGWFWTLSQEATVVVTIKVTWSGQWAHCHFDLPINSKRVCDSHDQVLCHSFIQQLNICGVPHWHSASLLWISELIYDSVSGGPLLGPLCWIVSSWALILGTTLWGDCLFSYLSPSHDGALRGWVCVFLMDLKCLAQCWVN